MRGGWPNLPLTQPHSGWPILRVLFAKGGYATDRTMGFAFHAARGGNEIRPQP
jgi:hypothetical protein